MNPVVENQSRPDSPQVSNWPGVLRFFQPDPPVPPADMSVADIHKTYKKQQWQILIGTMIGYAVFYFVRKNLSVAMPLMEKELGITKTSLGLFLTLHGIVYGVSKFVNGFLGDRCNGRVFMVAGLLACAIINMAFAFSADITSGYKATVMGLNGMAWVFGLLWIANGWFQGMGFPPCARLLTHWYPPQILATRMSVWNTSHSIGAAAVVGLGGVLVHMVLGWKSLFIVPSLIAFACCLYLWMTLKDTPESMGLPPVETLGDLPDSKKAADPLTAENVYESLEEQPKANYMKRVFTNPYIWIIALANFFVYSVRYAIFDWAPTLFSQAKGFDLSQASWISSTFELAGIVGMLAAGWITDNIFGGRGARTCLFYMAACTMAVFLLWKMPLTSGWVAASIMGLAGFCIYGPQALVGIAVANLATKHAAATAVGLTGLLGYLSGVVSGVGVGYVAQHFGWTFFFEALVGFSLVGTVLFALAWFAPAHGYGPGKGR